MRTASHDAQIATAWAAQVIKRAGWTLKADGPDSWEVSQHGTCFAIEDWRDLCRFAREVS